MTPSDLHRLHDWFNSYAASYTAAADEEARRNYLLKEEHTRRVCQAATAIAAAEGSSGNDLLLAEAVGLLHDVGRFPQYRSFRTFRDADSVNHAAQSVQVIVEERLLAHLPPEERRLLIRSVALHNVYRIPEGLSGREGFFLRLIRDADKLDIWRVFLDYYDLPEQQRASAVGLGFPDEPSCSPEGLGTIADGEMINLGDVRTLNDFKLLQLSWVFDLNFTPTRRLFRERGYLESFAAVLPPRDDVRNALSAIETYMERTISTGNEPVAGAPSWIR